MSGMTGVGGYFATLLVNEKEEEGGPVCHAAQGNRLKENVGYSALQT